jgi:chromate transporter
MSALVTLAVVIATTAIVSFGGIAGMIPEIQRQVVEVHRWMDNPTFATTFAISQIAPGPNILLMSLIGYRAMGFAGFVVATLSTVLPTSTLALIAGRLENRLSRARWYMISRRSVPPIVVGLMLASGLITAQVAITGATGIVLALGVAATVAFTRMNPLLPLLGAIVLGVVAGRLGLL